MSWRDLLKEAVLKYQEGILESIGVLLLLGLVIGAILWNQHWKVEACIAALTQTPQVDTAVLLEVCR